MPQPHLPPHPQTQDVRASTPAKEQWSSGRAEPHSLQNQRPGGGKPAPPSLAGPLSPPAKPHETRDPKERKKKNFFLPVAALPTPLGLPGMVGAETVSTLSFLLSTVPCRHCPFIQLGSVPNQMALSALVLAFPPISSPLDCLPPFSPALSSSPLLGACRPSGAVSPNLTSSLQDWKKKRKA